jgi:hypothetical protein
LTQHATEAARDGPRPSQEAGALLQKILGISVALLIIIWIVSDPSGAGNTVHSWITGIITFFKHIASA